MGAGASSKKTQSNGIQNDFSRLRVHKRGIRVTEAYDSDADDEFGYDAAHILSNEGLEEALEARRGMMEGGVEKAATQLSQLHPHTTTGKHLVAENGRQWGDPEPGIPDLALDFIYGYRCGESSRQTMAYTSTGDICYLTGGTFVTYIHAGGGGSDEEEEAYADEDVPHRQCAFLEAADCNNDFICMAMHHEGHIAAVGEYGPNAAVYVFNVYTMQILAKLTKNIPNEGIAALSFSADGELLAVVGLDQRATLLVFEWEKARMVARESSLKARQDVQQKVYAMRFCSSPENNNRLWTCATQETKFWDVDQQDDELVGSVLQYGMEDVVQTALCVTFDIHGDAITGAGPHNMDYPPKRWPNHLGLKYDVLPAHLNGPNYLGLCALQEPNPAISTSIGRTVCTKSSGGFTRARARAWRRRTGRRMLAGRCCSLPERTASSRSG